MLLRSRWPDVALGDDPMTDDHGRWNVRDWAGAECPLVVESGASAVRQEERSLVAT